MSKNELYFAQGDTLPDLPQWEELNQPYMYIKQGELEHEGHTIKWYNEVCYETVMLEVDGKQTKGESIAVNLPYCVLCGAYYGCPKDELLFFIRAGGVKR